MAFEVTATRRRPQQFDSLAGQEFVVSTLKNAIAQGRIAHAYLFSGPRGVGKTTSARLLAKALNCVHGPTAEPCGECENCQGIAKGNNLDVIEIDGASNTGVNDVRVIKEEVMFPPTSSRYKIYIIDEVHMLSQSAFNALLKTIEEPPEYVVFIFATTETQKVPATIRSRCQQFNFQLLGIETIKRLLKEAADEMNLEAEDDALFWIAKEATGSMRDAYTLFDQVVSFSNGKITLEQIREKLGLVGMDSINSIMLNIIDDKNEQALSEVQGLLAKGVSIDQIVKDFTDYFRSLLLIKQGVKSENVLGVQSSSFPEKVVKTYNTEQLETALEMFLELYRNIRYSLNPRFELELSVSRLSRLRFASSNTAVLEQIARLKNDLINGNLSPVVSSGVNFEEQVKPRELEETVPVHETKQEIKPEVVESSQEVKTEETPVKEDVAENTSEPKEAKADIKDVLPAGVGSYKETEQGFVIEFGSRFYYQLALQNIETVRKKIQDVLGQSTNVVLSFSEKLEEERKQEIQKENEEKQKKEQQEALQAKEQIKPQEKAPVIDENHKYFVDDLITAFRGHEEK